MSKKFFLYFSFVIPLTSLIGGIWAGQYIDDGYHWGFIFSNALELLDGKKPFEEIFIQYGLGTTLIHSLILYLFNKNIFSLIVFTSILYSLSIYLIGNITFKLTKNQFYSLLSTFSIFLIFPFPTSPWPIYVSFFFIVLFTQLYISKITISHFISGFCLGIAYISHTMVYNYVILSFFILIIILITYLNKKNIHFVKKNLTVFSGFLLVLITFFIYLIIADLLNDWLLYQKIPFILSDHYNISLKDRLLDYLNFIFINSFLNFIYEPQFSFYSLIIIVNLFYLVINSINLLKRKFENIEIDLFVINLLILSLNFKSQIFGISKFATSLSLGIITAFYVINSLKNSENKFIFSFVLIFISLYSFLFSYEMTNSHYSGSRYIHFQDIKNNELKIKNENISYFSLQKWSQNTWYPLNEYVQFQKNLKKRCNLEYGVNFTSNSYFFVLTNYKKIQLIPFIIQTHKETLIKYFEPNLIEEVQNEINNDNLLLISFENNHKLFNLNNYYVAKKINLNKFNKKIKKYIYVYIPKKCKDN